MVDDERGRGFAVGTSNANDADLTRGMTEEGGCYAGQRLPAVSRHELGNLGVYWLFDKKRAGPTFDCRGDIVVTVEVSSPQRRKQRTRGHLPGVIDHVRNGNSAVTNEFSLGRVR